MIFEVELFEEKRMTGIFYTIKAYLECNVPDEKIIEVVRNEFRISEKDANIILDRMKQKKDATEYDVFWESDDAFWEK